MGTHGKAEKIRARLVRVAQQHGAALEEFNRIIADATASLAAIDKADTRVKQLNSERTHLLEELRLAHFEAPERFGPYRRGVGHRPIREQILDLVDELGVPVPPRIVFEYALASLNLSVPAARFASLRRDEERAYERDPQGRPAWVVPAINTVGLTAIPRLVTSSAWELERRMIASRTLRVNHLKLILVFVQKLSKIDGKDSETRKNVSALVYRSAAGIAPGDRSDISALEGRVRAELAAIEPEDEIERKNAAEALMQLPQRFQLWGRPSVIEGGASGKERAIR